MEKRTIRAFDLNDFPFAGGVFSPRFHPAAVDMISIENKRIGITTQLIQSATRLGQDVLPKGAKVTSRLQYTVKNLTQSYEGKIELIGLEKINGDIIFFVSAGIPLNAGDEINVRFDKVLQNSNSENLN